MPKGLTDNPPKAGVLAVVEAVLTPLARLLVEYGISSPEAESLLRALCVHEATGIGRRRGNKPNASRIALLTGLDRAEVARILRDPPGVQPWGAVRRHRVNRVLAAWQSDPDYIDRNRPAILNIKPTRPKRPTFWALANRYAPGVYPGLILSELIRMGAVEKLADGRIHVRTRRQRTRAITSKSLRETRARVRDLLQTMLNNATQAGWPRICRSVESMDIDPRFLPLIRKALVDRSEAMLSGVNDEFRSTRWRRIDSVAPRVRIGLTVFSQEEWLQGDPSSDNSKRASPTSRFAPNHRRQKKRH